MMVGNILLLICLITEMTSGLRYFKFERVSTTSPDSRDVRCVLRTFDLDETRAVKVDSRKGTCDRLDESWISNQITDGTSSYFKLWMTENAFDPTTTMTTMLPNHFMNESSIVIYIKLGTIYENGLEDGQFSVNVKKDADLRNDRIICYHINVRLGEGTITFNYRVDARWGAPIVMDNPFRSNTVHKITIRMTEFGFYFTLDDNISPLYAFEHRLAMTCDTLYLKSLTTTAVYQRLQFYYPL